MMFENPEYQVDEQSEEFRLLNPIVSNVGKKRSKKLRLLAAAQQVRLSLFFLTLLAITEGGLACVSIAGEIVHLSV